MMRRSWSSASWSGERVVWFRASGDGGEGSSKAAERVACSTRLQLREQRTLHRASVRAWAVGAMIKSKGSNV